MHASISQRNLPDLLESGLESLMLVLLLVSEKCWESKSNLGGFNGLGGRQQAS
jgi:hypothetical protein